MKKFEIIEESIHPFRLFFDSLHELFDSLTRILLYLCMIICIRCVKTTMPTVYGRGPKKHGKCERAKDASKRRR